MKTLTLIPVLGLLVLGISCSDSETKAELAKAKVEIVQLRKDWSASIASTLEERRLTDNLLIALEPVLVEAEAGFKAKKDAGGLEKVAQYREFIEKHKQHTKKIEEDGNKIISTIAKPN